MANHGYGSWMIDADKFGAVQPPKATKKVKVRIRKPSISIATARDRGCHCSRIRTIRDNWEGVLTQLIWYLCLRFLSLQGKPRLVFILWQQGPQFPEETQSWRVDGLATSMVVWGVKPVTTYRSLWLGDHVLHINLGKPGHVYPHPNHVYVNVSLVLESSTWHLQ